jgi:hypothetical protein
MLTLKGFIKISDLCRLEEKTPTEGYETTYRRRSGGKVSEEDIRVSTSTGRASLVVDRREGICEVFEVLHKGPGCAAGGQSRMHNCRCGPECRNRWWTGSDNGPERVGIKPHFPEHLMVEKDACVQEEALAYHPAEGDVCEAVAGAV